MNFTNGNLTVFGKYIKYVSTKYATYEQQNVKSTRCLVNKNIIDNVDVFRLTGRNLHFKMQQSKPPIAAKPKIPASRRFAGKVANSNLKIEFENKLTFSCDRTKNRSILKSSSQSFESLNSINKFHDEANEKHEKMSKNEPGCNNVSVNIQQSTVQQMKSKLFAKQQSEVTKVNKNELSTASNKILQEKYSKELEKFLGMRNTQHSNLKNEKALKRLSRSFDESLSEATVENASSEMQQKVLAAELKQAHSEIKKNVVEHVPVQQRYDEYKVK